MNTPRKVAVVILGWNGKKFIEKFLPSVLRFTSTELCEIIVADNCSTDDSVDYVKANFPTVRIIQNRVNKGYAGGYNEALRQVEADYFVLLNQDVEVSEFWIERVIAEMEKANNIAAAQPKLRAFHQRDYLEYAGACGGFLDKFGYAFCRGRLFDTTEKDEGQYDSVADIFWASGACLFVKQDIFWKAGGLDEDFFAHQEEIDLCWRIQNMGYRIICVPESVVYHVGGGSLPQGNPRKTYLNFRNNLMMIYKNMPVSQLWWRICVRIFLDVLAALQSVLKERSLNTLLAVAKAHFSFLKSLPKLTNKRQQLTHKSITSLYPKSIVWQYFIKGKMRYSELPGI